MEMLHFADIAVVAEKKMNHILKKYHVKNNKEINAENVRLQTINNFTYLRSKITSDGK